MKPSRPIFAWKPRDYLDPRHLQKAFAKWHRDYSKAWNEAHAENAQRSKPREVLPLKRATKS